MLIYRLKIWIFNLSALLLALLVLVLLYSLLLSRSTVNIMSGFPTPISLSLSAVALTAPVFAVMDALLSWLKQWREARLKSELIKVVEALSSAPKGMDLFAIERESGLPRKIVLERVNELILLGRAGVRLAPGQQREYFLS